MLHKDNLVILDTLSGSRSIFLIKEFAGANLHRVKLVLTAHLDLSLPVCFKRDDREVILIIGEFN